MQRYFILGFNDDALDVFPKDFKDSKDSKNELLKQETQELAEFIMKNT